MSKIRQIRQVPEDHQRLTDDERVSLVFDYVGDLTVDDELFDAAYLEEEIKRTAARVEPLLEALRDLHRYERLARLSLSTPTGVRATAIEGEIKAAASDVHAEAREAAAALRNRVKEMAWEHGADLARLEVLRSWWRQAAERIVNPETPEEGGPRVVLPEADSASAV